ncbi:ATP-binding protein [Streptomyces xantholiticus]|nr:ATP-binding protein [Streptomyces peucetius subsp. caesius ATCC 27952]
MKQSAAKTLGVAALGAAFAAAGAGTASAAPAVPELAGGLGNVSHTLPLDEVAEELPAGAAESLAGGPSAVTDTASTLPAAAQKTVGEVVPAGTTEQISGLLGGLPLTGPFHTLDAGLPVGGGLLPGLGV